MNRRTNRRGFTLGEVLVTVAIISVLAAVVIPAVTSQVSKGDQGRVQSELQSVRGAVQQFVADVRRYPNSLGQLIVVPTAGQSGQPPFNVATTYTTQEVERWRGPYLNKDSVSAGSTGYALTFGTGLPAYKFDSLTVGTTGVSTSSPAAGDVQYLVLTIPGMDQTTAQALDATMDDGSLTTGSVRWRSKATNSPANSGADTLKYLVMPLILK